MKFTVVGAAIVATLASRAALAAPEACESLSSLRLPDAAITAAQKVAAGAFTPPSAGAAADGFKSVPPFCRVAATLKPSSASDIQGEVWLRLAGWHGKVQAARTAGGAGAH